ncbi:MAG: hypothetical protein ACFFKA_04155 [Candidatus Thorarchaeota archaeon]
MEMENFTKAQLRRFKISKFMDFFGEGGSFVYAKTHKEALADFLKISKVRITNKKIAGKIFDYSVKEVNHDGQYSKKNRNFNYYIN